MKWAIAITNAIMEFLGLCRYFVVVIGRGWNFELEMPLNAISRA